MQKEKPPLEGIPHCGKTVQFLQNCLIEPNQATRNPSGRLPCPCADGVPPQCGERSASRQRAAAEGWPCPSRPSFRIAARPAGSRYRPPDCPFVIECVRGVH